MSFFLPSLSVRRAACAPAAVSARAVVRALAVAAAVGLPAAAAGSGACGAAVEPWIEQVNALRRLGLPCEDAPAPPLRWQPRLAASALSQAADLAARAQLAHLDARGRTLDERVRSTGYRPARAAENLALVDGGIDEALLLWRRSGAHCAALMGADYTEVGIACAPAAGEDGARRVWVMHLGRPRRP